MSADAEILPVQEAFSRQSGAFDAIDVANPLIGWVRERVRSECMKFVRPGDRLLELNAGTGIDSVFFAEQGIHVLATDQAPGMLAQLRSKQRAGLSLDVKALSFMDLDQLKGQRFDHIFSNFGGLNCTDRLDVVLREAYELLPPGGHMHLVIMPRLCLWELAWSFKGQFRRAFRRLKKGGTMAHLEGVYFPCHYYDPGAVARMVPDLQVRVIKGLSVFFPPPHMQGKAERWPRLTRLAERLENRLCTRWPFRSWGDHYLIILERTK
ncbi:MAG: methyltransferase domain-containing protein [Flavobacteriales bacterium]|nr:methyltransferase domain-containing protein [Flavobacteriales bacterium]